MKPDARLGSCLMRHWLCLFFCLFLLCVCSLLHVNMNLHVIQGITSWPWEQFDLCDHLAGFVECHDFKLSSLIGIKTRLKICQPCLSGPILREGKYDVKFGINWDKWRIIIMRCYNVMRKLSESPQQTRIFFFFWGNNWNITLGQVQVSVLAAAFRFGEVRS